MIGDAFDRAGNAFARGDWATFPRKNSPGVYHCRLVGSVGFTVSEWRFGGFGIVYQLQGRKHFVGGFATADEAKARVDAIAARLAP